MLSKKKEILQNLLKLAGIVFAATTLGKLFTELGVYTKQEMESHYEIKLEKYAQVLNIEVNTML